jgi:hypothetical protein
VWKLGAPGFVVGWFVTPLVLMFCWWIGVRFFKGLREALVVTVGAGPWCFFFVIGFASAVAVFRAFFLDCSEKLCGMCVSHRPNRIRSESVQKRLPTVTFTSKNWVSQYVCRTAHGCRVTLPPCPVSLGIAICGPSAATAVAASVYATKEELSLSIGLITLGATFFMFVQVPGSPDFAPPHST